MSAYEFREWALYFQKEYSGDRTLEPSKANNDPEGTLRMWAAMMGNNNG
jgi:hypothetical protein